MRIRINFAILILSLLIVLESCNQSSSDKETLQNEKLIVKYDSIKIPVDSTISAVGNYNHVYYGDSKGRTYLVVSNLNNELVYFDLIKKKIGHRIKFHQEGPDGIGYIGNFNFFSKDTIIIKGSNPLENYLLSSNGKKISTFSTFKFTDFRAREILGQPSTNISIFDKYSIQFTQALLMNDYVNNRKYFDLNSKAFALLDLSTGNYTFLPIKFPRTMHDKNENWDLFHFTPSSAIIRDKFFYTFPGSDSLYCYSINSKQVKQVSAPSRHSKVGNGVILRKKNTSLEEYFDVYAQNFSYVKILSDENNDLVFRFIAHPTKKWKNSGNLNDVLISKPFSIQIFDSNLNLVGETNIFFDYEYDFLDSFVGQKGLYISNNHPENAEINEKYLSYSIFKTKK